MSFGIGSILSIAAPIAAKAILGGDGKVAGAAGGGSQTDERNLIRAIQEGQQQSLLQERPLEQIKPSTKTTKETAEIFARIAAAIESNGPNAMEQIATSLMREMQAETGRIKDQPVEQPQQPAVQRVEAVELKELEEEEEEEEKYEEPFVSQRSLFG
jgi:hypothetical protein